MKGWVLKRWVAKGWVALEAKLYWFYVIILNFYGAYFLRNLSPVAQQNRIIKHYREQGHTKVIFRTRDQSKI